MLKLPLDDTTFTKGFLKGQGELNVSASPALATAIAPDDPFPDEVRALVATKVAGKTPEIRFGSASTLACTATFSAGAEFGIHLAHPGDAMPFGAPGEVVPPGRLSAVLSFAAEAQAGAQGAAAGPAGFSFGVSARAGSLVRFTRVRTHDRARSAQAILRDLVSDIRLPHGRGTLATLPEPGECVALDFDGFLELAAALNWGYSLAATEGFRLRDLAPTLQYAVKAKAAVGFNYGLAGAYTTVVRAGRTAGWARVAVHKRRDARHQFAAGFEFDANARVGGLPETADEFLAAFLGADVESVLAAFDQVAANTDLATLQKTTGKLLSGVVDDLASRWLEAALDEEHVGRFMQEVRKALAEYRSIDDRIVGTVTALYQETLGVGGGDVVKALRAVRALGSRADLTRLEHSEAWAIVQRIVGGDIHALVFGQGLEGFAHVQQVVGRVLDLVESPEFARLRELIASVKQRLRLDELFGRLERVATRDRLAALTDTTLQGLVERIVGKAFEDLKGSELGTAARELHDTLGRLQAFKETLYQKLQASLNQSVSLRLNYLYTRASSREALVDVEIDLRAPGGEALFAEAVGGRLRGVLDAARAGTARVHEALLTHEVTKSSELRIGVLGWEHKRLVEVVAKTTHSIEAQAGGLVQVFTTEAEIKRREESGRKHKELLQTNLLLRMTGETFGSAAAAADHDFIVGTLEAVGVEYSLLQSDALTDIRELEEYLRLGAHLGLVPDGYVNELRDEFPGGLGAVTAKYVVRFDHKAIHDAFTAASGDALEQRVRLTARRVVASQLVTKKNRHFLAPIGLAYADPAVADLFYTKGFRALETGRITVRVPGAIAGGSGRTEALPTEGPQRKVLATFFEVERRLSARLRRLDEVIDEARTKQKAVSVGELEEAARDVAASAARVDHFAGASAFFAMVDQLIGAGGMGKAHRESALVLDIAPPGGQRVTKFFMQGQAG